MNLTKKELKMVIRSAVEALALQAIRTGQMPLKDDRDYQIELAANTVPAILARRG